jgi:flagella basal body P-ring formation protein FlgA
MADDIPTGPRCLHILCGAAILLLVTAALPAAAATLRPMTTLEAPVVKLSDLFDDAGPLAARVLGPAPAPGERIVVHARQLAAIARMFGVAWHPASPADTAVLERPGRLLPRQVVDSALRAALVGVGAPADFDIRLPGFAAPMIPLRAHPVATVEQLDYDAAVGRFSAALLVTAEGMTPLRLRLAGRVEEMASVPVPARRLAAGSVPRAEDLITVRVPVTKLRGEVARDAAQIVGMVLRRPADANEPVPLVNVVAPGAVEKGAHVVLQVEIGGLVAATQGIALVSAAPGERIEVLNPLSHMIVEGRVLPSGIVHVAPGSLPVPASAQALMGAILQ